MYVGILCQKIESHTVSENRKHMKLNLDFETLVRKVLATAKDRLMQ